MLNRGNTKPFKTYEEQLDLLIDRGLIVKDREYALSILKRINYYRFSAYSLTLRKNDVFYPNVLFENIYQLYLFDYDFRQIILRYSFHVEIAFRSYISYYHSEKYDPQSYLDPNYFENPVSHARFITDLNKAIERSDDIFVEHHKNDLNSVFPIWVVIEVTSLGMISKLYKNMLSTDRTSLAKAYVGRNREYVENWLQCCSYCRNVAAHGGRFYNRKLKSCPVKLSKSDKKHIDNTSPFAFLIAINNLLPSDELKFALKKDIKSIFAKYSFALNVNAGVK